MSATTTLESWRHTWRSGIAPHLSTTGLTALRNALLSDDPRLVQGRTCVPLTPWWARTAQAKGGCPVALACWLGEGLTSVEQMQSHFDRVCEACNRVLEEANGDKGGCRHFLNFADVTPRADMILALLPEVELALADRGEA